jgi:hypothetical protein
MTPNNFSNISVATTLVAGIGVGDLSMTVVDATGYPAAPFSIVIDLGSVANEEAVLVTAKAGVVWTISRAYDGTTAKVHSAGATVIHAALARDFRGLILGTREMSTALPANGDAVVWNNGAAQWEPGAVSSSGVVPFTYATGTLTLAAQPTPGDTITIGVNTWTYVDVFPAGGEIFIDATLADTQANTVSNINIGVGAVFPEAGALPFSADVSVIVAGTPGTAGNGIVTTSAFTSGANFFGQASLSGGTDGITAEHIQAQTAALSGSSPASPLLRLQASPGQDALAAMNLFELLDADGNELIKIDGGGNFYTLRALRMVDALNSANFTIAETGQVYFRFPDIDDTAQWVLRGASDVRVFALRPRANTTALIGSHGIGAVTLEIDTNGLDDTDLINVYGNANFDLVFRVLQSGAVVIAQHIAPDDSKLNIGDMAIWFDQTDGASKFMIKAKNEIGTVVSGEVALT